MPGKIQYSSLSDEALVDLFYEGDDRAFAELVARNIAFIKSYLLYLLGDANDADDVSQDVLEFMVKYFRRSRYHFHTSFNGWLTKAVLRTALRFLKRRNNYDKMRIEVTGFAAMDACSRVNSRVKNGELFRAIRKLSVIQQMVIRLHFFGKKTIEEIAVELKLSIGTARSHYSRALKKLFRILILNEKNVPFFS